MEIIEQIGSYAGLAAIIGLAILSALYFSQARDVRRLREAEQERAEAASARPVTARGPQRPGAAVPAAGAAAAGQAAAGKQQQGAPAPGTAAPAAAAQAQPAAVAREGNGQSAAVKEAGTRPAGAEAVEAPAAGAKGAAAPPAAQGEGAGAAAATGAGGAPAATGAGATPAPAKPAGNAGAPPATPAPSGEGAAQRPIPRPAPSRLPAPRPGAARRIPPLPGSTQAKPPWYRRLAPRYIVLLVAGLLVLGAGAAFGIATLAGEGGDEAASDGAGVERAGAGDSSAPLDPSTIEVAVLNGTSISGAAESVSDSVEQAGFQIGNVANATEQTSAESAVLFAEGARSAAGEVGRELGISQLEPVDTDTQDLAGTADVVVVVGADQAE